MRIRLRTTGAQYYTTMHVHTDIYMYRCICIIGIVIINRMRAIPKRPASAMWRGLRKEVEWVCMCARVYSTVPRVIAAAAASVTDGPMGRVTERKRERAERAEGIIPIQTACTAARHERCLSYGVATGREPNDRTRAYWRSNRRRLAVHRKHTVCAYRRVQCRAAHTH